MKISTHLARLASAFAVVAALAVFASTAVASAASRPDVLKRYVARQNAAQPDVFERYAARQISAQPDVVERFAALQGAAPDVFERYVAVHPNGTASAAGAAQASRPVEIVSVTGGFDWADAGVGAAMAVGLLALLGGSLLLAGRRRQRVRTT